MKPADNDARMADGYSFRDRPLKVGCDLDALLVAKARQDRSHAELDSWIADAIAELTAKHQPR